MGFSIEIIFLYFNMYDSFVRKATLKWLAERRYFDYKLRENKKLEEVKVDKRKRVEEIQKILTTSKDKEKDKTT